LLSYLGIGQQVVKDSGGTQASLRGADLKDSGGVTSARPVRQAVAVPSQRPALVYAFSIAGTGRYGAGCAPGMGLLQLIHCILNEKGDRTVKIARLLLLVVSFIYCGVSYAESGSAVESIQQRISSADEKFQQALVNTPEKEMDVALFFTNDVSLGHLKRSLRNIPLTVKGFLHGTPSYGGGYSLGPGETLDQAIASYNRDHLHFLKERMQMEDKMFATETDEEARKALISHRKESEEMISDFKRRGIRIIGLDLYGKIKEISTFKEKNSFVRAIELKENGEPQSAILPPDTSSE